MRKKEHERANFERTPIEKLLIDIKVTAGSRFNASARLTRREKSSTLLESVYSALLICVSIATFTLPLGSAFIRYASFGGIVASILLLVMSMRKFGHRHGVEAEQMHRCALELNELKRRIQAMGPEAATTDLVSLTEEYSCILQKWSVNHTQEDYLAYKYKHKHEFEDIANVPDKELPDRQFQEYYSATVFGVAIATIVGILMMAFIGWILWDSVSELTQSTQEASINREADLRDTMDALLKAERALDNASAAAGSENSPASNASDPTE